MKRYFCLLKASAVFLVIMLLLLVIRSAVLVFDANLENASEARGTFGLLALMLYACYGAGRALLYNPLAGGAENLRYRLYLQSAPWSAAKPLPLGPIHVVWQDVALLPAIIPFGMDTKLSVCELLALAANTCAFPYILANAALLSRARQFSFAYLLAFGAGGMFLLPMTWAPALGALLCLVAFKGQKAALDRMVAESVEPPVSQPEAGAWWPSPDAPRTFFATRDALLLPLLAGWCMFIVLRLMQLGSGVEPAEFRKHFAPTLEGLLWAFAIGAALIRVAIYCIAYWPPISFFGRIATGRFIIPGYDKVFIAPICTLLAAAVGLKIADHPDVPLQIGYPAVCAFIFITACGLGPTLRTWKLTGMHRIGFNEFAPVPTAARTQRRQVMDR